MSTTIREAQGFSEERLEKLATHLQSYVDKTYVRGLNAVISRRGELVFERSFGRQGKGNKRMQMDSLFRIYSMTKPITSVAALMLYEEARFMLDDSVAKFLPAFNHTKVYGDSGHFGPKLVEQERPMTIRDLLTHMSGLSYGWYQDTPVDALYRGTGLNPADMKLGDFVTALAELPLVFQPGTAWRYSYSTDVLGHLIEVVADEPLNTFLERRIFNPLGMENTSFVVPSDKLARLTSVYSPTKQPQIGADYSDLSPGAPIYPVDTPEKSMFVTPVQTPSGFAGGGGLVSTMPDYLRFAQMLLNGGTYKGAQLLGRKTVELMTTNHVPLTLRPLEIGGVAMPGNGFGLGVAVVEDIGLHGTVGSNGAYGWSGAAMTNFWIDPKEDLIGLCMTQFIPSEFYRLSDEFRVMTYGALVS